MIPARIVGVLILLFPTCAFAQDEAALCNAAAIHAANNAAMPPDVLRALTLVETGRTRDGTFAPWPWTVNMEGQGHWFATRAEAVDYVTKSHASGARSFDVGCFQINHRWHGEAFTSFDQMFDPFANATYAASFMSDLFAEGGSWSWAAGAYHSRTTNLAAKYRDRFDRIFANLPKQSRVDLPVIASNKPPRTSTWNPLQPLEMAALPVKNGSLAQGLVARPASPLLGLPTGALF